MTIEGEPPWTIEADEVTAYQQNQIYIAEGNVKLTRGDEVITGNVARYHAESETAEIKGNVHVVTADIKIVCERLVANLRYNIGKIYNGKVFFPANHYYVAGDEIERTGPDTFLILKGRATTCDGPNPAWTLTGENITVEREGFASVQSATFSTRFFPMLYFPWMRVPLKTKRQSGILTPGIGNSERDGFTFTLPIYWAASDSKDMTIYLNYMSKRGMETTVEGRFRDWGGKGTLRVSYLNDLKEPSISFSNIGEERIVKDRYWIRGMSDLKTESGFDVKLDVDYASDPDYLDEFKESYSGYENTKSEFLKEFGREPAESLDPLRKSILQATKTVNQQNFKFALEYTQDLRDPDNYGTIQRLPRIGLDMSRQAVAGTPFYFSSMAEYNYFQRKTNKNSSVTEQGHRLDIHPIFYWPVKFAGIIDMETSLGLRETLYYPHGMNVDAANPDDDRNYRFFSRELFDFSYQAYTNVSRVYNVDVGKVEKIKHRIKPEFKFTLVPDKYQGDLPYWDSVDRIAEQRSIRYGVTNYLTAKVRAGDATVKIGETGVDPSYTYVEFVKLGLFRSYDFVEENRDLVERTAGLEQDFRRPHSAWELDLETVISSWFWLQARSQWDTYTEHFVNHDWEARFRNRRGDYLSLEYEMNLEPYIPTDRESYEYEQIKATLNLKLADEWYFSMEKHYSIMEEFDIESRYTVSYSPQCWGVRLQYIDKPDDRSIAVYFSLLGLGEIGGYSHQTESGSSMSSGGASTN